MSMSANGHRRDLPPIEEPIDWLVACSLLASCIIAVGIIALTTHYAPEFWKLIAAHLPI